MVSTNITITLCAILLAICLIDRNVPDYIVLQLQLAWIKWQMFLMRIKLEFEMFKIRLQKQKYIEWARQIEDEMIERESDSSP